MKSKINLTLVRTDKKNKKMASNVSLTTLLARMKANMESELIDAYRTNMKLSSRRDLYGDMLGRLHRVYASVRLHTDKNGTLTVSGYNDMLMLSAGPIYDEQQMENAKLSARVLPCTLATFVGASGMTLKILVKIELPNAKAQKDEGGMRRFFSTAYMVATNIYTALIGETVNASGIAEESSAMMANCRISADDSPYVNPKVAPLMVKGNENVVVMKGYIMNDDEQNNADTTGLISFVGEIYKLRYNKLKGCVEYLDKDRIYLGWNPADERFRNGLTISARQAGLNVWNNDVVRYLNSNRITVYDPVEDWLFSIDGKWDGEDHIGRLAETVKTDLKQWKEWFRMWFVGMVAQWMGRNVKYANSIVPLLVSPQGYHKSTFCRQLLPENMRWGYLDNLQIGEKKTVMQSMAEYLLINLDEFNSISAKVQQGFLKNTLQLTTVNVKRPYARRREDLPRMASFIATSNMTDVLSDPSGSRRFFVVNLTEPINTDYRPDYQQLYAQAVEAVRQNEQRWFDARQTELVMEHNRQFEMRDSAEMVFHDCFELTSDASEGEYLTTSDIFTTLRKYAGAATISESLPKFGRYLSNLPGIVKRTSKYGTQYLLKRREK
ncbi:MAG: VapE domain-containing protein [Prevotella sp.]